MYSIEIDKMVSSLVRFFLFEGDKRMDKERMVV